MLGRCGATSGRRPGGGSPALAGWLDGWMGNDRFLWDETDETTRNGDFPNNNGEIMRIHYMGMKMR